MTPPSLKMAFAMQHIYGLIPWGFIDVLTDVYKSFSSSLWLLSWIMVSLWDVKKVEQFCLQTITSEGFLKSSFQLHVNLQNACVYMCLFTLLLAKYFMNKCMAFYENLKSYHRMYICYLHFWSQYEELFQVIHLSTCKMSVFYRY